MDFRLTLHLGQTESGSNIGSSYISIRKTFKICRPIATLSAELALEIRNHVVNISVTNTSSQESTAHVTEYAQELQLLKNVRVDQITSIATEITRLWCLLDVGEDTWHEFMGAHSTLSAAVIEQCAKEIEHLVGLGAESPRADLEAGCADRAGSLDAARDSAAGGARRRLSADIRSQRGEV
jgi:hypothetical protein